MFEQIAIGVALTVISIVISGFGFWVTEALVARYRDWLTAPPHPLKIFAVVISVSVLVLAVLLAGVFVWAATFRRLGMFADLETSFYYALVSYTTVGYGEITPAGERRILGAMAAANGFINIGLLTTFLIRGLHYVREGYRRSHLDGEDREEGQ